ncbi:hypothetical protein Ddc_01366 [Ditylenchus destructor]|nr:hypothetical protein Ddc_01366 [Ditylenchus destructor]
MFPVIDIDGKFIESKRFIFGLPVMNYLELVAVIGIVTSVLDALLDMSTGLGFPLLQVLELVAFFIVIRSAEQTSSWYVLSMLFVGMGILLRITLNVGFFGLPALLYSQQNLRERIMNDLTFANFRPSDELTDSALSQIRTSLILLMIRSIAVIGIFCVLFLFIERARELAKHKRMEENAASPSQRV